MRIATAFLLLTPLLLLTSPASAWAQQPSYSIVDASLDQAFQPPLYKVDATVQAGADARNRFLVHRVAAIGAGYRGSILLLPSLLSSFAEYAIDGAGDTSKSLAATLALAGYEVWGYSPRTATLPAHACSSGAVDCSVLSTWGMSTYLDDVEYVRQLIAAVHPGRRPAVGGMSLGGMLGMGAVNAHPGDYAGLLVWESLLYSTDPAVVALNQQNCAQNDAALAAGVTYNEQMQDAALGLLGMGEAALVQMFGVPLPALGTPAFTGAAPKLDGSGFVYADFARFGAMIRADHSVESVKVLRDVVCSLAGDRAYTSNLGAFTGPVLAIGGGLSFGAYMPENLALLGSQQQTFLYTPEFGHVDAYMSASHAQYVEQPILAWLDQVFPRK